MLAFSYEKSHMENVKLKSLEQVNNAGAKEPSTVEINPKSEAKDSNQPSKASMSSATEQDLDVFLLGEDSDDDPGTANTFSLMRTHGPWSFSEMIDPAYFSL